MLWLSSLLTIGVDDKPAFSSSVKLVRNLPLLCGLLVQSLLLGVCLTHLLLLTALLLLFFTLLTCLLLGQFLVDSLLLTFGGLLAGFLLELADEFLTRDDLTLLALPELGGDHLQLSALKMVGLGAGVARDEVTLFFADEAVVRVLQWHREETS